MHKNLFTILDKESDILNLPGMVRLDSYLANESKTEAPAYNQHTIFMLPGIEGTETNKIYNFFILYEIVKCA